MGWAAAQSRVVEGSALVEEWSRPSPFLRRTLGTATPRPRSPCHAQTLGMLLGRGEAGGCISHRCHFAGWSPCTDPVCSSCLEVGWGHRGGPGPVSLPCPQCPSSQACFLPGILCQHFPPRPWGMQRDLLANNLALEISPLLLAEETQMISYPHPKQVETVPSMLCPFP